jgi:hypothetical protein
MFWFKLISIIVINLAVDVLTFRWLGDIFGKVAGGLVALIGAGIAMAI